MPTNFPSTKSQADAAVLERGIEQLQLIQDHQRDQKLLDWLCPLKFSAQQSDFFSRRQDSSGQWLLTHDKFKSWLATPKTNTLLPCTSWFWENHTRKYCSRPSMEHHPWWWYRHRLRLLRLQKIRGTNIQQSRGESVEPAASATAKRYIWSCQQALSGAWSAGDAPILNRTFHFATSCGCQFLPRLHCYWCSRWIIQQ